MSRRVIDRCRFHSRNCEAPALDIEVSWSLADLLGYVDTWSAVRGAEKAIGRTPIEAFRAQLTQAWGDPQRRETIRWPLSLRVGALSQAS